jgi:hypothetical protein
MESNYKNVFGKTIISNGLIFIFPIGIISNILNIVIYSRPSFQGVAMAFYLRVLACTHIVGLFHVLLIVLQAKYNIDLKAMSDVHCIILNLLIYVPATSAWIEVILSFDRLLMVSPQKYIRYSILRKRYFQIAIVLVLFLVNIILYLPFVSHFKVINSVVNGTQIESCYLETDAIIYGSILNWVDFFNSALIPFLLMSILTINILRRIKETRRRRRQSYFMNLNKTMSNRKASTTSSSSLQKQSNNFLATSIALNIIFINFNFPITLIMIFNNYYNNEMTQIIFAVCVNIYYYHMSMMFFLYLIVNSLFRKEFISTFLFFI